jgi:hypothetical protein
VPASGWVILPVELKKSSAITVSIHSITGSLINKTDFKFPAGNNDIHLDISGLTPGIYMCKISGSDGNRFAKIVVQ